MIRVIIPVLILSACTPAGLMGTDPVYQLSIQDIDHKVQKLPGTENGWAATPSNLMGGRINPEIYARNVQAIEKHTGCKIRPETISNQGLQTTAAVKC